MKGICPVCESEVEELPEKVSNTCSNCSLSEQQSARIIENITSSRIGQIDSQPGYNLYEAHRLLSGHSELPIITEDVRNAKLGDYGLRIRRLVAGMVDDDGRSVRINIEHMKRTPNGMKQKIKELWERDKEKFYDDTYVTSPWDKVLREAEDVRNLKYEESKDLNGEVIAENVFDRVPEFIEKTDTVQKMKEKINDKYSPLVKTTKEDYTGATVKFIGTYHYNTVMLDAIKEELKDCDLVLLESGPDDDFHPRSGGVGHRAADARNALSTDDDIIRVLEGRPGDVGNLKGSISDAIYIKFKGRNDSLKSRQKRLDRQRQLSPEWYEEMISKRDHKFVIQAIENIIEEHNKNGVQKVAIVAGKDHIPGMYQYFDSIGFGERKKVSSEENPEGEEKDNDSMLGW